MLPSTSGSSPLQGNGALSSRDAARHTAGAKRYKYLRRLFRFRQMDFEFAAWQMLYLFTSPQRVYRNFHYRKQTKDQWARDDPAFLVLLGVWLCGKCRPVGEQTERLMGLVIRGPFYYKRFWVSIWVPSKLLPLFCVPPASEGPRPLRCMPLPGTLRRRRSRGAPASSAL